MPTIPVGDLLEQTFLKLNSREKDELKTILASAVIKKVLGFVLQTLVKKYSQRMLQTNLLDPRDAETALREQGKYAGALEFLELINHVLDEDDSTGDE